MAFTLRTLMPTVITPNSQTIVTDIDNDQFNELIVFDSDLKQLSIVDQFKYSDFTLSGISPTVWPDETSQIWPAAIDPKWMTAWAAQEGMIPASQGSGGWTIESDDVIVAADLDGDGLDELFIYNLTSCWWGVLKWNSNTNQLQAIYQVSVAPPSGPQPVIPLGDLTWTASTADQYFIIPKMTGIVPAVPGDGILLYNSENLLLGMISYQASPPKFVQWWENYTTSLNNWNLENRPNDFYVANFSNAGPSLVVYGSGDGYINLLTWNGSEWGGQFPAQHNVGGWTLRSTDQFQCADLDGDGLAEILIYNPDTQYLGVFKWNNTSNQFEVMVGIDGTIVTGSNSWTIGANDQYYCQDGSDGNPGQIYAFSSQDSLAVAVLNYGQGAFSCQWSGTSLSPNNEWPVNQTDKFYISPPSSSATPNLFTLSNQGSSASPKVKLGALNWSKPTLQIASSQTVPVLAWSPSFLAEAPELGFPPFTVGNQPAIYTYVSNLFPLPTEPASPPIDDVRKTYYNASDQTKFESYASAISEVQSLTKIPNTWPPLPPGNTWCDSDWASVINTIANECIAVDTVYSMSNTVSGLSQALHGDQEADLATVKSNIKQAAHGDPSDVDYWSGQIAVMLLWGLAAAGSVLFPEAAAAAAEFGVFGSMGASAFGSIFGYDPTQQKSYAVSDIEAEVSKTYAKSMSDKSADLNKVLKDALKLKICNGLHENEWKMDVSLAKKAYDPFTTMDRVWMYQQLIPAYFSIETFNPNWKPGEPVPPPPAYVSPTNVYYALITDDWAFSESGFQATTLYQDLFQTLGVSEEDFFVGNGGWVNIPRSQLS
jgi:hypothetical protein